LHLAERIKLQMKNDSTGSSIPTFLQRDSELHNWELFFSPFEISQIEILNQFNSSFFFQKEFISFFLFSFYNTLIQQQTII